MGYREQAGHKRRRQNSGQNSGQIKPYTFCTLEPDLPDEKIQTKHIPKKIYAIRFRQIEKMKQITTQKNQSEFRS